MFYNFNQLQGEELLSSNKYLFRDLPLFSSRAPDIQFQEIESIILRFLQSKNYPILTVIPRDIDEKMVSYANFRGKEPSWITIIGNKDLNQIPKWVLSTDANNSPDILEFSTFLLVVGYP